jgi:tRNA-dihydrouridine synthase
MTNNQKKIILYLAPLRGLTDYIYRNTYSRHFDGFDAAVSPFIPTMTAVRFKKTHLKDVLPENNSAMPIIPQIIGNNPEDFIPLAQRLFDLGYKTVNWNLGCPFPMVAKKQRGSGLLPYPQKIEAFLEKTIPAIPNRLSIKARLGRNKTDEILTLLQIFHQYPLDEVIVHPRTGKQMYDGEPDLDMFEKCLQVAEHKIVYNGDINDLATFKTFSKRFKTVDRWMIGRGALANPFLPQYRQAFHGPGHLLDRMKGFWTYFSRSFQNSRQIKKKIHRTQKLEHYLIIVDRFFEEDAKWVD